MSLGSVGCRQLFRYLSVAALALIALAASSVAVFAAAKDEKKPALPPDKAAAERADRPPGDLGDGRLIRVRLPLSGNDDKHIIAAIQRGITQLKHAPHRGSGRPILILELTPEHKAGNGQGTDFTRALSLANFLTDREVSGVKTVAYIPRTIKGHGVLVALACDEIVMSPDAELGAAGIDEDPKRAIDPKIVNAYREVAAARRTVPEAIALSMVDKRRGVLKVETEQSIEFIPPDGLEALKKNFTVVSQDVLIPPGSFGSFTGRQLREFGIVKLLANDEEALARGLNLPADVVQHDLSLIGQWRPVMIRIEGPITARKVSQLKTIIGSELKRKVNWIGITIDSTGGDLNSCLDLVDDLVKLDASEAETVAYVPAEASGGAACIALACKQLVMHPEAHIGGAIAESDKKDLELARQQIQDSLGKNGARSWSLFATMIDPSIELFSCQNIKTGEVRYLSNEERNSLPDKNDWRPGLRIKQAGERLRLDGKRAAELGIATHVVASFDEFKQLYGFNSDIRTAEPNWALELVEALASPGLAILLLVIGFVGIYVELHAPGTGIGGFVAALAFLLFFWSHFLYGTAGWLEVLLFLGGIFCLLLEVLVIPGFGIFGLGGGVMILASLVLASQTFVFPRTESQMAELRHSLTIVAAAMVVVVGASIALRRYLPKAPVFRTIVLEPTPEEDLIDLDYRESLADFTHLIGQKGTASTNLMPAGKAEFGGELIDVIAEGMPIDRGTPIIVTKTRGNRVLVRRADV
jgi:membrane-bound ClpP family serine protease